MSSPTILIRSSPEPDALMWSSTAWFITSLRVASGVMLVLMLIVVCSADWVVDSNVVVLSSSFVVVASVCCASLKVMKLSDDAPLFSPMLRAKSEFFSGLACMAILSVGWGNR